MNLLDGSSDIETLLKPFNTELREKVIPIIDFFQFLSKEKLKKKKMSESKTIADTLRDFNVLFEAKQDNCYDMVKM